MRVLLIEDEAPLQRATSRMIQWAFEGVEITLDLADNPNSAIALLEANTYDFVVSDFNINNGNGGDVLIWIEKHQTHMVERFVFFSGAKRLDEWHDKIIEKGIRSADFIEQLRAHLPMVAP